MTILRYDDSFVGSLAILIAVVAAAIGCGPWVEPYRLRSFAAICERFGKPVARGVWVAIAVALMTSGFAILSGMRPGYALPATTFAAPPPRE